MEQDYEMDKVLDWKLLEVAQPVFEESQAINADYDIKSINRSVGAILSYEISKIFKKEGLPEDTLNYTFNGSAGQSFGAFLAKGVTFKICGESNDYFGKGMSGGKLIIYPPEACQFEADKNMIIGNVAFYGATSGEAYINGLAGERFGVRNSGVRTVVEGVGDHACEYMTGGRVIVLGETGTNFAAGMSGGIAYVLNEDHDFDKKCNKGLVGLEELQAGDIEEVKKLINNHYNYTGSKKARQILDNFDEYLQNFIKIIPHDFKRVMEAREKKNENDKIVA